MLHSGSREQRRQHSEAERRRPRPRPPPPAASCLHACLTEPGLDAVWLKTCWPPLRRAGLFPKQRAIVMCHICRLHSLEPCDVHTITQPLTIGRVGVEALPFLTRTACKRAMHPSSLDGSELDRLPMLDVERPPCHTELPCSSHQASCSVLPETCTSQGVM